MELTDQVILQVLQTAVKAGKEIMTIYQEPFSFELKSDHTPITIADKNAHDCIVSGLSDTALPLLSEEGNHAAYEIRKDWKQFWLIDPLDGTKEFIKKNGDFTVNIALIENQLPAFGVVYAPVSEFLYWGSKTGSFRLNIKKFKDFEQLSLNEIIKSAEKLPCVSKPKEFIVLGSISHLNPETESFVQNLQKDHPDLLFKSRGSSLKFCILAEGGADIYPRFGPTMEWDTAAGHAVATYASCKVLQAANSLPLIYNKSALLNPDFIAYCKKNEVTN